MPTSKYDNKAKFASVKRNILHFLHIFCIRQGGQSDWYFGADNEKTETGI